MNTILCPSPERLAQWLADETNHPDRLEIERHVLHCEICSARALAIMHDGELPPPADTVRTDVTRVDLPDDPLSLTNHASFIIEQGIDTSFLGPPEKHDELGRLGDYRVLSVLGRGGMGVVFLAEDVKLGRQVAIKTMDATRAESDKMRARFLREARAAAALESDYLVPIYHVAEENGMPLIAMPVLMGESLRTRIQRAPVLQQADVLRIGHEIALGLMVAHQHGLIHRDIKPANVWLDEKSGRTRVLDFGLAREADAETAITHSHMVLGTPQYMSPEQALGDTVDFRSDLYSLGAVLYCLVCGQPPFQCESVTATLVAVAHDEPESLQSRAPEAHLRLVELVMRLLEKNPDARPDSTSSVAEQLAEIRSEVEQESIASSLTAIAPNRPPSKPPKKRWLAAAAAAFLCALIVITILNRDGIETVLRITEGSVTDVEVAPDSILKIQEQADATPLQVDPVEPTVDSSDQADLAGLRGAPVLVDVGAPLALNAIVPNPAPIPGVRSWSIELKNHYHRTIRGLTCSPCRDFFATGSADHSIRLWHPSGELKSILLGHTGEVTALSFSPAGRWLASVNIEGHDDNTLRIWRIDDGTCVKALPLVNWGWFVAWSPDGSKIAFDDERGKCKILDLKTLKITTLPVAAEPLEVYQYVWSDDSQSLALESSAGLAVYHADRQWERQFIPTPTVPNAHRSFRQLAKSADGRRLASPLGDEVRIWDFDKLQYLKSIDSGMNHITELMWYPKKRLLVVVGGGGESPTCLIRTKTGKVTPCRQWDASHLRVSWGLAEDELISGIGGTQRISFVDVDTGKTLRHAPDEGMQTHRTTALLAGGKRIVSGGREFDANTGELVSQRDDLPGELILVAPDDSWRAYQTTDTGVLIQRSETGSPTIRLNSSSDSVPWRTDPSGTWIGQVNDDRVLVWSTKAGTVANELEHPARVLTMEFSPDGSRIATLGDDEVLRVYDLKKAKELNKWTDVKLSSVSSYSLSMGSHMMQWAPDGNILWLVVDQQITHFDVTTGEKVPHRRLAEVIDARGLRLSPDGSKLVVTAQFWRTWLYRLSGERSWMGACFTDDYQWYPGSRYFLTGGPRGHINELGVRVYDSRENQARGTLFPHLTDEHWMCVGPNGNYRGSEGVESQFVYVVQLENGSNLTLSPADFRKRFDWENDPGQVRLLP